MCFYILVLFLFAKGLQAIDRTPMIYNTNLGNLSQTEKSDFKTNFKQCNKELQSYCTQNISTTIIITTPMLWCDKYLICNVTTCIIIEELEIGLSQPEWSDDLEMNGVNLGQITNNDPSFSTTILPDSEKAFKFMFNKYKGLHILAETSFPMFRFERWMPTLNKAWSATRNLTTLLNCTASHRTFWFQRDGEIPDACTQLRVCDDDVCLYFGPLSLVSAKVITKRLQTLIPSVAYLNSGKCLRSRNWAPGRMKRNVITRSDFQPNSRLFFNLPGYKYCGPGTNVEVEDDAGGPVNELDEACRSHDVDYILGVPPSEADSRLLVSVQQHKPNWLPLFIAAFEAKTYFENAYGYAYTSSLYFYSDDFSPSLTLHFRDISAYFTPDSHRESVKLLEDSGGQYLDTTWKTILEDIWLGVCYRKRGIDEDEECSQSSVSRQGKCHNDVSPADVSSDSNRNVQPNQQDTISSVLETSTDTAVQYYPKAPFPSGCRLLINEVATKNEYNKISFIEHKKICPPSVKRSKSVSLNGFVEIVLLSGTTIQQVLYADFFGKQLSGVPEVNLETNRRIRNFYALMGTDSINPTLNFNNAQTSPDFAEGFPNSHDSTLCIILLFFSEADLQNEIQLAHDGSNFVSTPLTVEKMNLISENVQDVVIFGRPCPESECGFFFSLLRSEPFVVGDGEMLIPIAEIPKDESQKQTYKSHSRCSNSYLPMQVSSYQYTVPTPGITNVCNHAHFPFVLQGISLQSTAQKIIVNIKSYFEQAILTASTLTRNAIERTATVTGSTIATVYQVLNNYRLSNIETPGKKRKKPSPIANQFDQMRLEQVKKTIQEFYKNNRAPTFDQIYDKFMSDTGEEESSRRKQGEQFVALSCSRWSFKKLILNLGFKYGTINKRAVVLMRNDIVSRRGEYLKLMKRNRESETPRCVIYTDETWIDPYSRTGKSWIPKHPKTFREEALYSFQNPKSGRGPRVIILHAGGPEGFVEGAMKVYQVSKKKVNEDYHSNVDGNAYMHWWKNLNRIVKEKYGACDIVIDNAPYHSTSEAPKSNDKKDVFYNWLAQNLDGIAKLNFKTIKEYRRPELWKMVQEIKNKNGNKYYLVDKEAEKFGNRVIRLPPYNCDLNPIEYVWKDIKHAVRANNTEATAAFAQEKAKTIMNSYTKEQWKRHCEHVVKLEAKYWEEDGVYDSFLDHFEESIQLGELPAWVQQGVRITQHDIDNEDDDDEWGVPLGGYDTFRASVHDDMVMNEYTSVFAEPNEDSLADEPDPQVRRVIHFDTME